MALQPERVCKPGSENPMNRYTGKAACANDSHLHLDPIGRKSAYLQQ